MFFPSCFDYVGVKAKDNEGTIYLFSKHHRDRRVFCIRWAPVHFTIVGKRARDCLNKVQRWFPFGFMYTLAKTRFCQTSPPKNGCGCVCVVKLPDACFLEVFSRGRCDPFAGQVCRERPRPRLCLLPLWRMATGILREERSQASGSTEGNPNVRCREPIRFHTQGK